MSLNIKKISLSILSIFISLLPLAVSAAGFVHCDVCTFEDLKKMAGSIMNWIVIISIPIAAGVFAWAGFLLMTTSIAGKKEEAKKMIGKVFWGLIFILGAWLIVNTIMKAITKL